MDDSAVRDGETGQAASTSGDVHESATVVGPGVAEMATMPPTDAERREIPIAEQPTIQPQAHRTDGLPATDGHNLHLSYVVAQADGRTCTFVGPRANARLQASFAPGSMVQGRYVLVRELGRGGMGVVFLGRDIRLDRPIALKVILGDDRQGSSDYLRESFESEARLGAKLTHPAIAIVFDYGFHEGSPFTVFEFIAGQSLRDVLARRGRLPLDEARLILGTLAQALDFAHERQVVHRDLKPENVRATEQGLFKILDLGLARDFQRTREWRFCGTPAYASPEQAADQPCDGRSDQYALGLIAYEMLTGRRPFEGADWVTLLDKHVNEPPPLPQQFTPDLPDSVCSALMRALAKSPNDRFPTCTEFAVAFGCQLLTSAAPAPEVLLETDCRRMWGRWKSWDAPFSLQRHRVHLALAPDALWGSYRTELMCWPLSTFSEVGRSGRKLNLRIADVSGKSRQVFLMPSRAEARAWCERLRAIRGFAATTEGKRAPETDNAAPTGAAEALEAPKLDPVILLKNRPSTRFQLLGTVETSNRKRRRSRAGLLLRGAMMGADAVVGATEERLADFRQTTYRNAGIAVRAIDHAGRLELKSRWFDGQARGLTLGIMVLATLSLFAALAAAIQTVFVMPDPLNAIARILLPATWLFVVSLAFARLRWPQLARPTAICFITKAIAGFLGQLGAIVALAMAIVSGSVAEAIVTAGISAVTWLMSVTYYLFYLFLGRRTWQIHRGYRDLVSKEVERVRGPRRAIGRVAMVASLAFACWTLGTSAIGAYNLVSAASTMRLSGLDAWLAPTSGTGARGASAMPPAPNGATASTEKQLRDAIRLAERAEAFQRRSGVLRRTRTDSQNSLAWHLAIVAPPDERKPEEAIALVNQALDAFPNVANYWNTLGAAEYAAGHWQDSQEALRKSMDLSSGGGEADWWLMAAALRRSGDLAGAEKWHRRAAEAAKRNLNPDNDVVAVRREYESLTSPR